MAESTANSQQEVYWTEVGGVNWVKQQRQFDHMLAPFGDETLRALAPQPGERVLDIGCGTATTTLAIAGAVEPGGHAVGFDISSTMIEAARNRASDRANVSFVVGDAQIAPLAADGALYDAVFSRMGVMFFADPVAAFANVGAACRAGARMAFTCWRHETLNPWIDAPATIIRQFTPEPVFPPPNSPGPFGFQDSDRVRGILADAGWVGVSIEPFAATVTLGEGKGVDAAVEQTLHTSVGMMLRSQVDDETFHRASRAVRDLFDQHLTPDGVQFAGNVWVVTATTPR